MSTSNLFFKGCASSELNLDEEQKLKWDEMNAELIANGEQPVSLSLVDESCARETNTCAMDLSQLLDTYELYDFQRGVFFRKWGDVIFPWELSPTTTNLNYDASRKEWSNVNYIGLTSYYTGDRVLYIEDDGYVISVYEANQDIPAPAGALDRAKWDKFCSIEFSYPVELPTIEELIATYQPYFLKEFLEDWGEANEEWKIAEEYKFTIVSTSSGNKYVVNGVQQDTLNLMRGRRYLFEGFSVTSHPIRLSTDSGNNFQYDRGYSIGPNNTNIFEVPLDAPDTLYYYCLNHSGMGGQIAISDIQGRNTDEWGDYKIRREFFYKSGDFVLIQGECGDTFCLWINVKDIPVTDQNLIDFAKFSPVVNGEKYWEKIYCVDSGRNKCLGPQSDRNLDNYQFVEIGSKGHYVEQPIPNYKLKGNYLCDKDNHETLEEAAELQPSRVLTQNEIDYLDGLVDEITDPSSFGNEPPPASIASTVSSTPPWLLPPPVFVPTPPAPEPVPIYLQPPSYQGVTPFAVNGYYPLYTSVADALTNPSGDGTTHTHTFNGVTYYMPGGLGAGQYHGTYGRSSSVQTSTPTAPAPSYTPPSPSPTPSYTSPSPSPAPSYTSPAPSPSPSQQSPGIYPTPSPSPSPNPAPAPNPTPAPSPAPAPAPAPSPSPSPSPGYGGGTGGGYGGGTGGGYGGYGGY